MKTKVILAIMAFMVSAIISCGNSKQSSINDEVVIENFYQYVIGGKNISDEILNTYLSPELKKSLWTDDYDGCYEIYKFRTSAQDCDEAVGDINEMKEIKALGDGWYVVTYMDMGNYGQTIVRVVDEKIVDYVQDKSWASWED